MVYSLQLERFIIHEKTLDISVKGNFQCQKAVKAKISIIFDNGHENRRLPILTKSSFFDKEKSQCFFHAEYKFLLQYVFWDKHHYEDINLRFSLNCSSEYQDVTIDFDEDIIKSDNLYYKVKTKDGKLAISLQKEKVKGEIKAQERYHTIYNIYTYIMLLIGIFLTPFFAFDGLFATYDLSHRSPDYELAGNRKLMAVLYHINWRLYLFSTHAIGRWHFKLMFMEVMYWILKHRKVRDKQVAFISGRRPDLTGNFEFIHKELENNPEIIIKSFLNPKPFKYLSFADLIRLTNLLATSRIAMVDDFFPNLYHFKLKEETTLIQVWHAVGAFKTFGFSRMGKPGGTPQISPNHRSYDLTTVSSQNVVKFYAEGFGLSNEKVVATGVPRTDVFFDEEYRRRIIDNFYGEYPHLRNKKIILFAPTFRGKGKEDAFYPVNKFKLDKIIQEIKDDGYAIIIKHHPFVTKKMKIPREYQDYILDLSLKSEINDLLFITDLLITDYSSVIFEAALLNIPMLFYAYDLHDYIDSRDFYYDFENFVPGKIVFNQEKVIKAIKEGDFQEEKIKKFKNRFFDHLDGKSTQRFMDLLCGLL